MEGSWGTSFWKRKWWGWFQWANQRQILEHERRRNWTCVIEHDSRVWLQQGTVLAGYSSCCYAIAYWIDDDQREIKIGVAHTYLNSSQKSSIFCIWLQLVNFHSYTLLSPILFDAIFMFFHLFYNTN